MKYDYGFTLFAGYEANVQLTFSNDFPPNEVQFYVAGGVTYARDNGYQHGYKPIRIVNRTKGDQLVMVIAQYKQKTSGKYIPMLETRILTNTLKKGIGQLEIGWKDGGDTATIRCAVVDIKISKIKVMTTTRKR